MDRKRPQLSLRELYQLNWFLGAALAILALLPAFLLDLRIHAHLFIATLLIAVSIIRPQIAMLLPSVIWNAVPFMILVMLALDFLLLGDPLTVLIRLNILLVCYRTLAFRRKREDLQLVVLSMFLLIIGAVIMVSIAYVLQILLFTALTMAFLFNITLMESSRGRLVPGEIWTGFTWRQFLSKSGSHIDFGSCVMAGGTFLSVILCSVLLFILIPRIDISNPIPLFGMSGQAQTGFSESIRFGDVTSIRNNNRVALRVEGSFDGRIPADPYWRMLVLDEYVNGGFQVSRALLSNAKNQQRLSAVSHRDPLIGREERAPVSNVWTFYLEGGVARYLPLTGIFDTIRFQESRDFIFMAPTHVLGTVRVNTGMLVYQVENMTRDDVFKDPDFGTYVLRDENRSDIDRRFGFTYNSYPATTMALPPMEEDVEYLRSIVDVIGKGEALTAAEFASRATDYLQRNHSYSMTYSIPPGDRDHVVRWLMSGQPGHCEVFAAALLLICRTAGIPSRVVTGFRGGTWNGFENYFMVRHSDAHAWVEVFDGRESWLRFDPTPGGTSAIAGGGEDRSEARVSIDSSWGARLDSIRIIWYRRIVNFDQERQFELFANVRAVFEKIDLRKWSSDFKALFVDWFTVQSDAERRIGLLKLTVVLGCLFLIVTLFARRNDLFRLSLFGTRGDRVRWQAGLLLQRLLMRSAKRSEEELRQTGLGDIVLDLQRLRFGPLQCRGDWRETLRRARRLLRSL